MLLANMAAASKIALHLPEQALLRRHEDPIERRLTSFKERLDRLGFSMDISSAGSIMKCLEAVQDPELRQILGMMSHRSMHRAKYFCSGMLDIAKYQHYALNVPLYTHFTSPIRRYADVVVHRQLESAIQSSGKQLIL